MGKKTKEHRKRVEARKQRLIGEMNSAKRQLTKLIEEFNAKNAEISGSTESQ